MATFVLTDANVTINSVDLSDRVRAVSIDFGAEMQDDTTMGAGTRTTIPGLLDWTIEIEYVQDFAANEVDITHFTLVDLGTEIPILVRPTSATISATNPEYTAQGFVESYPILGNSVGEIATTTIRYRPGGATPTLIRDVTP